MRRLDSWATRVPLAPMAAVRSSSNWRRAVSDGAQFGVAGGSDHERVLGCAARGQLPLQLGMDRVDAAADRVAEGAHGAGWDGRGHLGAGGRPTLPELGDRLGAGLLPEQAHDLRV
ncbi:hypothetical protein GCM10010170_107030 [Dactylosporangium salmoneum]|uniref:Uncharacterized protein n=1 Tax=Dactylosporangium salmoneum TaxID=53361 RepID=A0ABP5V4B7_9ACTN